MVQGSAGKWTWRADAGYVRSDGTRPNAQSQMRQADLYVEYRPDDKQYSWLDIHAIDADSGDPGRLSYPQWQADPRATPTPWNRDWVDRYQIVLGHQQEWGDGWLFIGKLWATYQAQDSRGANGALPPQPPPSSTTLQSEQYRTQGMDLRVRKKWGHGNAFTAGAVLFHGNDPWRQWTFSNLYVDRYARDGVPRLDQKRESDYYSVFAENVFRLPHEIHIVPSIRLEKERVAVSETVRPPFLSRPLINESDTRTVPLFGLGIGNDFGHGNETYLNVSKGWRPLRYFDMASPFANVVPGNAPNPQTAISWEAGVHGVPVTGLYYDVSVFWIDFKNRIEAQHINATDVIEVNSGDTRNRGFEGEIDYDFFADTPLANQGQHLDAFANLSLLNARFTRSVIPGQVGKIPAYAPRYLAKAGVNWRIDKRVKVGSERGLFRRAILAGFGCAIRQRRHLHPGKDSRLHDRRPRGRLANQPVAETAGWRQQPHRPQVLRPRVDDRPRTRLRTHLVRRVRVEDVTIPGGAKARVFTRAGRVAAASDNAKQWRRRTWVARGS